MGACRAGDTLVLTKLDRLARSLPDARAVVEELARRQVKLSPGGAVHDHRPGRPAAVQSPRHGADFEGDLIRMRTR